MGMSTAQVMSAKRSTGDIVAGNIRAEAARLGYTQVAFGRALGMSQNQITTRWRGVHKWQLDELDSVAELLGTSVARLVSEPETQNPHRWIAPRGAAARPEGLEPPTFWLVIDGKGDRDPRETPRNVVKLIDKPEWPTPSAA